MITTGNTIVSIYTEMTPNPETMKFVANKLLYPGKSIDIADENLAFASPLAKELFSFPFIKSVFIASNFVTLTKNTEQDDWQDVIPTIKTFLKEYLENELGMQLQAALSEIKNIDESFKNLKDIIDRIF